MDAKLLRILLLVANGLLLVMLVPRAWDYPIPGNDIGYTPVQPIRYSHRLHAGELGIGCLYCHSGADRSRHAGIPAASVCMNCHKFISAPLGAVKQEEELAKKENRAPRKIVAPEIHKLYLAQGLNDDAKPDASLTPTTIEWVKVHDLADFVYFDHRRHVNGGVDCLECHGPVDTMEVMRQTNDLSMGWCLDCHRRLEGTVRKDRIVHPSLDCMNCHQ
ncbi:MAG TPA: cytochrome c3 family protein [Planctomycetota bacterium]|jgi:hypothetical protein|nr:cytochrome c3 family protein [Planctomycetota bacterium]